MRHPLRLTILIVCLLVSAAAVSMAKEKEPVVTSLCGVEHPSDTRIKWQCFKRPLKKSPRQLWGDRWVDVLRFNRVDRVHFVDLNSLKVPEDLQSIRNFTPMPMTYKAAEKDGKFILIDLDEQFLAAYEFGKHVFSTPITTGKMAKNTPPGMYQVTAFDRDHRSTEYPLEHSGEPYPMRHGLMFFQDERGMQYWIHGRDMPGYPGSHGCIGLYDENMTKNYFGQPEKIVLRDAQKLFEWAIDGNKDKGTYTQLKDGPRVEIRGKGPKMKEEELRIRKLP